MNKVKDKLPALVEEELAAAMEEHPLFASAHEGYAVLLEEVEEAEKELREVQEHLDRLWKHVKCDNEGHMLHAACYVYNSAINLAAEAVQVAAMAKKVLVSFGMVAP